MGVDISGRVRKVLVVDDNLQNRRLAEGNLVTAGYAVVQAEGGQEALDIFAREGADLVLLDVLMPGLDGFEVCRRLRGMPGGTDVGIVFLTSLGDLASHHRALDSGADDFLTKPINRTELLLRVRSLLWMRKLREELREGYELIRSQRAALVASRRQQDELVAFVVHDLRNPLANIVANTAYLREELAEAAGTEVEQALADIGGASASMERMLEDLLDLRRSEDGALPISLGPVDLAGVIGEIRSRSQRRVADMRHTLEVACGAATPRVMADATLLRRMIENLLDNAVKFSPPGSRLRIETGAVEEGRAVIRVIDEGPTIPEEERGRIFNKYVQLHDTESAPQRGRGLGLAFCRLAAEVHGARIWVEPAPGGGNAFCILLPARSEP